MIDRAYGGPEEGGWWFDYGEPNDGYWKYTRLFETEDEAYDYGKSLNPLIDELNEGRPSIGSVASEGIYGWVVQEGYPHAWPKERPRYE
jgi:hypothetical protein